MNSNLDTLGKRIEKECEQIEKVKKLRNDAFLELKIIISKLNDEKNIVVKKNILKILDNYIYNVLSWMLYEITTNKYPCGENYHNIDIKMIHLKNHLENEEYFDNEIIFNKIQKDFMESITMNLEKKYESILELMKFVLHENSYKKFIEMDLNQKVLQDLCNNEIYNLKDSCLLIEDIIDKINDFFIEYIKEQE